MYLITRIEAVTNRNSGNSANESKQSEKIIHFIGHEFIKHSIHFQCWTFSIFFSLTLRKSLIILSLDE